MKIEWLPPSDKAVPNLGLTKAGAVIDLPEKDARAMVENGLAKFVTDTEDKQDDSVRSKK